MTVSSVMRSKSYKTQQQHPLLSIDFSCPCFSVLFENISKNPIPRAFYCTDMVCTNRFVFSPLSRSLDILPIGFFCCTPSSTESHFSTASPIFCRARSICHHINFKTSHPAKLNFIVSHIPHFQIFSPLDSRQVSAGVSRSDEKLPAPKKLASQAQAFNINNQNMQGQKIPQNSMQQYVVPNLTRQHYAQYSRIIQAAAPDQGRSCNN